MTLGASTASGMDANKNGPSTLHFGLEHKLLITKLKFISFLVHFHAQRENSPHFSKRFTPDNFPQLDEKF